MKLVYRTDVFCLMFFYKVLNGYITFTVFTLTRILIDTPAMRGRDDCVLKKNYARTDIFKFSFFNRIVDMRNALPPSTPRCAPSIIVVSSSKCRISCLLENTLEYFCRHLYVSCHFTFLMYIIIPFSF